MIKSIVLDNVDLKAFASHSAEPSISTVWNSNVVFHKGKNYLIEAGSGRGKSSFCSFICGLRDDYVGEIYFEDENGVRTSSRLSDFVSLRQRSIGIMFQELRLFPELSAVDNVMLKSQLTGYVCESEIREMLSRLGLKEHLDRPCGRMSLGQQQRVAFVRALAQPADFVLLDEPVSHLDEENAEIMVQMLHDRQKKDAIGLIVTSIGYRLPIEYDCVLSL